MYNYNQFFFLLNVYPLQGQEPGWQSLGGSVFPSPEEAPSATSPGTEPTGTQSHWEQALCQQSCPARGLLGTQSGVSASVCVCVRGEVGSGEARAGICSTSP